MPFEIRPLDPTQISEIELCVHRAMATILESIPEFKGDTERARQAFPNFSFEAMKAMFVKDYGNPEHATLLAVAQTPDAQRAFQAERDIWGHAIFSVKTDAQGLRYGFCYSRYVKPEARCRGVASALLQAQEIWWQSHQAQYALAQTHVQNHKLQGLFLKHGYERLGPKVGPLYDFYELRKKLNA